jgi:hypothetical protein
VLGYVSIKPVGERDLFVSQVSFGMREFASKYEDATERGCYNHLRGIRGLWVGRL